MPDYDHLEPPVELGGPDIRLTPPEPPQMPQRLPVGAAEGINPKDAVGCKKPDLTLVPPAASLYCALAMANGAKKYGRGNYRLSRIQAVTYVAAAKRHLDAWLDGEEFSDDTDPPVPHLGHALASISILIDAIENGNVQDDRPAPGPFPKTLKRFTLT